MNLSDDEILEIRSLVNPPIKLNRERQNIMRIFEGIEIRASIDTKLMLEENKKMLLEKSNLTEEQIDKMSLTYDEMRALSDEVKNLYLDRVTSQKEKEMA